MEGLVHTKADIVGEQIKGVALATDLQDVSSPLYGVSCCAVSTRHDGGNVNVECPFSGHHWDPAVRPL